MIPMILFMITFNQSCHTHGSSDISSMMFSTTSDSELALVTMVATNT